MMPGVLSAASSPNKNVTASVTEKVNSRTKSVQYQYSARRARPLKSTNLLKHAPTAPPKPIDGTAGMALILPALAWRLIGTLGVSIGDMVGGRGGEFVFGCC